MKAIQGQLLERADGDAAVMTDVIAEDAEDSTSAPSPDPTPIRSCDNPSSRCVVEVAFSCLERGLYSLASCPAERRERKKMMVEASTQQRRTDQVFAQERKHQAPATVHTRGSSR